VSLVTCLPRSAEELREVCRAAWQQALAQGEEGMTPADEALFERWWVSTSALNGWVTAR